MIAFFSSSSLLKKYNLLLGWKGKNEMFSLKWRRKKRREEESELLFLILHTEVLHYEHFCIDSSCKRVGSIPLPWETHRGVRPTPCPVGVCHAPLFAGHPDAVWNLWGARV